MKEYLENRITELHAIATNFNLYSNDLEICKSQIAELEKTLDHFNLINTQ